MPPDIYATDQMLEVVESLRKPPRYLLDTFFPNVIISQEEQVSFDSEDDNLKLAPFVSPVVAGKVLKGRGYTTKSIKPAYVKPKRALNPAANLRRQAGERLSGQMSPAERAALLLAQELGDQDDMITRRLEVMAAEVLKTGKLTIEGEDYPKVILNYGRHADLTKTLAGAARWGEAGVSPVDDVEDWIGLVQKKSGVAVNKVVFGSEAWKLYAEDPKAEKAIDRTLGQNSVIQLGYQAGDAGQPIFKGMNGNVELVVYNDIYTDDAGAEAQLLDDYEVLLGGTVGALGTQGYGAILDQEALVPMMRFPKSWIEKDPGVRMVMTQCAPVLFPRRPNGTFRAKVR